MEAYTISFRNIQRYIYCDVTVETFKINKPLIKLICMIFGGICFQMVGISLTLADKLKIADALVELGQFLGLHIFWVEESVDFCFIVIKIRMFFLRCGIHRGWMARIKSKRCRILQCVQIEDRKE